VSYNGSGTFNINSAGQPVVTGTVIASTPFNALTADLGTGLSTAITKDGQTTTTARIPFAAGINSSLVTDATNTTTGSIITAGGVGVAKALFVGTTLAVTGITTVAAGSAALPAIVSTTGTADTGLWFPAADTVAASTAGTERLRIDSSGNVGIGTTAPVAKLGLVGGTSNASSLATAYSLAAFNITPKSTSGYSLQFGSGPGDLPYIQMSAGGTASGDITIQPYGGNVGIGTTSPSAKVTVIQAADLPAADFYTSGGSVGTPCMYVKKQPNDGNTSQVYIQFLYNSATSGNGQINGNGGGSAAFGSYSDIRLKENVVNLPSQLNNIMSLRPVEFDWKDGSGHQIGFIAQEVTEVYPDIVGENADGMLTLTDMNKNDARLIKCIQEQQALILALTDRIAALEAK